MIAANERAENGSFRRVRPEDHVSRRREELSHAHDPQDRANGNPAHGALSSARRRAQSTRMSASGMINRSCARGWTEPNIHGAAAVISNTRPSMQTRAPADREVRKALTGSMAKVNPRGVAPHSGRPES